MNDMHSKNRHEKNASKKNFIAISPSGKIYHSDNQLRFAKEHNLYCGNINHCLKGKYKSHKGWSFKYSLITLEE